MLFIDEFDIDISCDSHCLTELEQYLQNREKKPLTALFYRDRFYN